ncbi:MAG: hypothetical protein OEZ22_03620 [Spirochaetia bacterium]|nr:hypothetical protein [Spirochaetia bacterium]
MSIESKDKYLSNIILFLLFFLFIFFVCKKKPDEQSTLGNDIIIEKKFAKYRAKVFADKSLKNSLTVLEKAEEVGLLEELETSKKEESIARIRLADGKEAYVEFKHLANMPVVFIENTKAFNRPTISSKIVETIPKGTLGFILEQNGGWSKIYIGKINENWITRHWVETIYYKTDNNLVFEIREYENALNLLVENKIDEAKEKLEDLSNSETEFVSQIAKQKLQNLKVSDVDSQEQNIPSENTENNEQIK